MTRVRSAAAAWCVIAVASALAASAVAADELFHATDPSDVLDAARAIIADDPDGALITLDAEGRPRVRTVTASSPDDDMVIWIATRPDTRKVAQIGHDDRVTLYFNHDARVAYVSVMGRAKLHDDPETLAAKNFYDDERLRAYWPDYPKDFLLIEVVPEWIEVVGYGVEAHPVTWRPQAVVLASPQEPAR